MRKGVMNVDVMNEDWKTAIAHNQRNLKKGEEVEVIKKIDNLYGSFYYVRAHDGETYYVKPSTVDIIEKGGGLKNDNGKLL